MVDERDILMKRGRVVTVREVACGLLVFGLLFGEEAGEGDDVSVDLLLRYRLDFAVTLRHFLVLDVEDEFLYLVQVSRKVAWTKWDTITSGIFGIWADMIFSDQLK